MRKKPEDDMTIVKKIYAGLAILMLLVVAFEKLYQIFPQYNKELTIIRGICLIAVAFFLIKLLYSTSGGRELLAAKAVRRKMLWSNTSEDQEINAEKTEEREELRNNTRLRKGHHIFSAVLVVLLILMKLASGRMIRWFIAILIVCAIIVWGVASIIINKKK